MQADQGRTRAIVRGVVLLAILVTGAAFHVAANFLEWHEYYGAVSLLNHITHTAAPVGFLLDWLLFDRKGLMKFTDIFYWLIFPALYWCAIMLQGAFTGFYPYFFMEVDEIGYSGALLFLLGMFIAMSLLGGAIIKIDHITGRAGKNRVPAR